VKLGRRGVRADVINPGRVDVGWMSHEIRAMGIAQTSAGRPGTGSDAADLVRFPLSDHGPWLNGRLL
jgi:3-oxoacyl-[acyl-carrier protein] reductase